MENEVVVQGSFEKTWDRLVKGLAKSFYVINNIEKSSRIINVSFSTESPEEFIDCGKSHRIYQRGDDRREYLYEIASSSSFLVADKAGAYGQLPVTLQVNRQTSLEGRVNIFVAPQEQDTLMTVNSRYVFSVRVDGISVTEDAFGRPASQTAITPKTYTHSFNTNQPNRVDWGRPGEPSQYLTCYSTGKLEGDILGLAR